MKYDVLFVQLWTEIKFSYIIFSEKIVEECSEVCLYISTEELGGMKVLHGLDKVVEGGAVVLTLKDQSILAGDDINQGNQSSYIVRVFPFFFCLFFRSSVSVDSDFVVT